MPRKPPTHKRADVRAAIKLMEMLGQDSDRREVSPDGTFRVMTADHAKTTKPEQHNEGANEWDTI